MSGKAGKPTNRSRNFALQRKNAPSTSSQKPVVRTNDEWRLHGPNLTVKRFPGMVSRSENLSTSSVVAGRFFATQVKDLFKDLEPSTKVYGVIFRYCLDVANGALGLIKGFNPQAPTAPNPLNRRRFVAKQGSGVQILAPTDMTVGEIPEDLWFVVHYDSEFKASVPVWVRTQYLQHSMPPRVEIPDSVLMTERDAPILWDAMDKLVAGK